MPNNRPAISFPALHERVVFRTYSRGAMLFAKQLARRMITVKKDPMVTKKWKTIKPLGSLMWIKTMSNFQLPTASGPTAVPRCAPQFLHIPFDVSASAIHLEVPQPSASKPSLPLLIHERPLRPALTRSLSHALLALFLHTFLPLRANASAPTKTLMTDRRPR